MTLLKVRHPVHFASPGERKLILITGDMHNRQAVTPKLLWYSLLDWEMWPVFLIGLSFLIPSYPATAYLTLKSQIARVQYFPYEPAHNSCLRTFHYQPALLDLGLREDESTVYHRPDIANLVFATARCSRGAPCWYQSPGQMGTVSPARRWTLCSRNKRGDHLKECRKCPHTNCCVSAL
jgi:hypothetical protein